MARKNRWEHLNDFKKDENGKYTYAGEYYTYLGTDGERKRAYSALVAVLALSVAGVIGSGCINAAGMNNSFYVIIPYIAEVASLFTLVWNSVKLLKSGEKIKAYNYLSASKYIPPAALMLSFFAAAGFVCSVMFIIFNGFEGGAVKCVIYLLLKLADAALAAVFRNLYLKAEWVK